MKKIIRLTEGDLHKIVKESVNKIINEKNYDREEEEMALYNKYGNQSQHPAYEYLPPFEGELGMTAQYNDDDIELAMMDGPEYFLDGKDHIYRSKKPGDYRTKRRLSTK